MFRRLLCRALPCLALLVSMTLVMSASAAPTPKKGPGPPAEAPGDKDKPFQDWKKVTKDAEISKGFFTVYKKRENLYLELTPDQLNKPVLGIFSFARGIGSNFILGGLPLNDRLLQFQRAGDHVLLIEQNTRFVSPSG